VSYAGVGVLLSEPVEVNVETKIQLPEGIRLQVRPVYFERESGELCLVGNKIEFIEQGEQQWANLCYVPRW